MTHPAQNSLALIDIEVQRNAYGRQLDSFSTTVDCMPEMETKHIPAVFIRAPKISQKSDTVTTLVTFQDEPMMVRQKNIICASFHPEMTEDLTVYRYFTQM